MTDRKVEVGDPDTLGLSGNINPRVWFEDSPAPGQEPGWYLYYLDDSGDVAKKSLGGDPCDVDWARKQAEIALAPETG